MIRITRQPTFDSKVPNYEGLCCPVWINTSSIDRRFTGAYTGFFRPVKFSLLGFSILSGPEFHGAFAPEKKIVPIVDA